MKEIAISKLKATCLGVMEEVHKTGTPVRISRFGKPIVEIVAPDPVETSSWLGRMKDSMKLADEIVGPIGAFGE